MAAKYAILILSVCLCTQAELKSPCPSVFNYQSRDDSTDRWYGLLNLESNEDTVGVELKLTLDKPALQLGNLFGKTITHDLKEFIISNRFFRLAANSSHLLRFYVTYDPNKTAPALINIEQNDRRICPNSGHSGQPEVFVSVLVKPIPESILISSDNVPVEAPVDEIGCGTIAAEAIPLIAYGVESYISAYPWHSAIYSKRSGTLKHICGGSLVSKQIVVTTAICLSINEYRRIDLEDIEVHLGKQIMHKTSPNVQIRKVSERIPHPGHKTSWKSNKNNIGLLKLKESVTFSDFIRPVCLNPPNTNFGNLIGKIGTIPGWKTTEVTSEYGNFVYATLEVVSHQNCAFRNLQDFVSTGTFCAMPVNGSAPCDEDGGAGLVVPEDSNGRRIYYLRGISAIGSPNCKESNYELFTDPLEYLNFIKANL